MKKIDPMEKYREHFPKFEDLDWDRQETLDEWELLESLGENRIQCKLVLIHRFGLFNEDCKTLQKIGDLIGVGRERVRSLEAKGLRILRHPSKSYLYPLISNKKLFQAITGAYDLRDLILRSHVFF